MNIVKEICKLIFKDNNQIYNFYLSIKEKVQKEEELDVLLKQLYEAYPTLDEEEQRMCLLFSGLIYNLLPYGKGEKASNSCFALLPEIHRTEGESFNEAWVRHLEPRTPDLTGFVKGKELSKPHLENATCVPFNAEDEIVCCRKKNGDLVLILHQTTSTYGIICEEEGFMGEAPLYFMENGHFISPVWKLVKARDTLNAILHHYKYPHLRIKLCVMYSNWARLINEEDMISIWEKEDAVCLIDKPILNLTSIETAFPALLHQAITDANRVYEFLPKNTNYKNEDIISAIKLLKIRNRKRIKR